MTGARVADPAGRPGVLHQHAAQLAVGQPVGEVGDDHLDAHRLGAGAHDVDGLRQRVGVDHERAGRLLVRAAYERHRLGGGGALVEQRGVGGRQAGEVADHGLEVEQRLEPALRDLGLVRRVGGVPARVLEHVAPDHRRGDRAVVAEPDHRLGGPVRGGELAQLAGHRRPRRPRAAAPARRRERIAAGHGRRHQRVEGVEAERLEHRRDLRRAGARCGGRGTGAAASRSARLGWSDTEGSSDRSRSARSNASPSVGPGSPALQSCLLRAVRLPERFRGGVAPSALRHRAAVTRPDEVSPARD